VDLLPDLSRATADRIAARVAAVKKRGDVVVASIHWGSNWGYRVPPEQRAFAHDLIDRAGVDVVHGHSSHHPRGIEVYRERPVLYGCGDFFNDYEGIPGYESYRGDLALMYFLALDPTSGVLNSLRMVPMQIHRFRERRASAEDTAWLRDVLTREGARFGTRVEVGPDGALWLRW
jgi:poly-gamma-glutamate synthesis protein (capsule biosynthesis protein)